MFTYDAHTAAVLIEFVKSKLLILKNRKIKAPNFFLAYIFISVPIIESAELVS